MKNIHKVGIVYHVIDKANGKVIKVGSTICSLNRRWNKYNKLLYNNHFLKEQKVITSSELDWYEPRNPHCPFLWHLVASEHMEMIRLGTFKSGSLSNKVSPLDQKYFGFDAESFCSSSGFTTMLRKVGIFGLSEENKIKSRIKGGQTAGHKARESGQLRNKVGADKLNKTGIFAPGMKSKGGKVSGAQNALNGVLEKARHTHWHINRGILSGSCKLCCLIRESINGEFTRTTRSQTSA